MIKQKKRNYRIMLLCFHYLGNFSQIYFITNRNKLRMIKNLSTQLVLIALLYLTTSSLVINQEMKNAQPYNPDQSKEYAYYAGLAYCPRKCLQSWNCETGKSLINFGDVHFISNPVTAASCYVGYQRVKNLIIVSFRGSANIQNVIQDINIQKVNYSGCKGCEIHSGFFADYRLIQDSLNQKIEKLLQIHPNATIILTGHSLGAALSEIAGLRLKLRFNKKTIVHNFGSTRVGNEAMASYIVQRVDSLFRVVHNRDVVPHFPSQVRGYHHSPFQIFWNAEMTNFFVCNQSGQDKNCSNKFAPNFDYTFADHHYYFFKIYNPPC